MPSGGLLEFLIDDLRDSISCLKCEIDECCNQAAVAPVIDYGSVRLLSTEDTGELNTNADTPVIWDMPLASPDNGDTSHDPAGVLQAASRVMIHTTGWYSLHTDMTYRVFGMGARVSLAVKFYINGLSIGYGVGRQGYISSIANGDISGSSSLSIPAVALTAGDYVEVTTARNANAGQIGALSGESIFSIERLAGL